MIIRILMTAMILLAIAKYYLHDSKQISQNKPAQQIENLQTPQIEIKQRQEEHTKSN